MVGVDEGAASVVPGKFVHEWSRPAPPPRLPLPLRQSVLRNLLICGLIAGLCGGLLATGFARLAGEAPIDRAIAFESAKAKAAGEHQEAPIVSTHAAEESARRHRAGYYPSPILDSG